jgi:molybdate transport system substrate-binding protein
VFSFGATGALYAQITQGLPSRSFSPPTAQRRRALLWTGSASRGQSFTYAVGKAVLYGPALDVTDGEAVLRAGGFNYIAIADPATAPYGAAAVAIIEKLGLTAASRPSRWSAQTSRRRCSSSIAAMLNWVSWR